MQFNVQRQHMLRFAATTCLCRVVCCTGRQVTCFCCLQDTQFVCKQLRGPRLKQGARHNRAGLGEPSL